MAKPNYSFAKRQRDLAKEQKKEEKLQRKKAAAAKRLQKRLRSQQLPPKMY